ncbi:MAG: hypothetical protein FP814_02560 [Desulfobacterium sp.]|nr:hypothetical protein [Desulfobacterium sp.]MBU3948262.1 hypothetical protein [Pseudomonadota bacterium]MBU4036326.1 hypothetical protein [Pseudomonadota bacterium]
MEEDNAPEFKINIDGINPDSFIIEEKKEEKKDIRIERLNRKITIISILFPCIVVILLMIIYFDIKNKIAGVHDSGATEVQNLSKTIDKKSAEYSSLYSNLEDSFKKKISDVDKMGLSLKANIDKMGVSLKTEVKNSVNEIRKEAKDNDIKTTNSMAQINKQLTDTQKDISAVSSKIKDVSSDITPKISSITEKLNKIENDFVKFRTSLNATVSEKIASKADKKEIEQAIKNEQNRFDYELSQLEKNVEQKINAIKRQLYELEHKTIKTPTPQALPLKPDNTYSKPYIKDSPSKPGKIIEQDL